MAEPRQRTIRWKTSDGEQRTARKWQAGYYDRAGKRHRRLFDLRRDAQKWLDEQTAGMVTGQWADPRAGKETLKAYAERWRARQVHSEGTADAFESVLRLHVSPVLGGFQIAAITSADVQALVKQWASDGAAPTTVGQRYTMLAIILRAAVRDRVIPESPCVGIKLPRVAPKSALVPITTETVLALRDAVPERYRVFVTVAAGAGMRSAELRGLTIDRVSSTFGTIRIDRQLSRATRSDAVRFGSTKTEASTRTIPVADVVLDAIEQHVDTFGTHETGLILTSEVGSPVVPSVLQHVWSRAAKEVGTDATPHDLRHYFASMQIRGGQSIKVLQALLGHKSAVETWDTYGHLMGDEDDRSRAVIEAVLGTGGHSTGTGEVLTLHRRRSEA